MNVVITDSEGGVLAKYEEVTLLAIKECERWLAPYETTEE